MDPSANESADQRPGEIAYLVQLNISGQMQACMVTLKQAEAEKCAREIRPKVWGASSVRVCKIQLGQYLEDYLEVLPVQQLKARA